MEKNICFKVYKPDEKILSLNAFLQLHHLEKRIEIDPRKERKKVEDIQMNVSIIQSDAFKRKEYVEKRKERKFNVYILVVILCVGIACISVLLAFYK